MQPRLRSRTIFWLAMSLLVVSGVCWFWFQSDGPAPCAKVVLLSKLYRLPGPSIWSFQRWIPATPGWGWLWRLKERVGGKPRTLELGVSIIDWTATTESANAVLSLGQPTREATNGFRAWVLPDADLRRLRSGLGKNGEGQVVSAARMTTGSGSAASLFSGELMVVGGVTNTVGLEVDMLPRVHRKAIDLTACIRFSELVTNMESETGFPATTVVAVRTNVDVGARMQIPEGSGVFLLDQCLNASGGKRVGILILAKPQARK